MKERLSPEELRARKLIEQYQQGTAADECAPWLLFLMYALLIVLALCCFSSCRVINKNKSDSTSSVDSSIRISEKFNQVQRLDSNTRLFKKDTGTVQSVHNYTRETTIKEYFPISTNGLLYFDIKQNSFKGSKNGVWKDTLLTGEAAAEFWKNAHGYRETTTKETGTKTDMHTGSSTTSLSQDHHQLDSNNHDKQSDTQLSKATSQTNREKKVKGLHWSIYVACFFIVIGLAVYWYLKKKAKELDAITNILS